MPRLLLTPSELEEVAASHGLDVDDFLVLIEDLHRDLVLEADQYRQQAADVLREAQLVLDRVRVVAAKRPAQETVDAVLGSGLSGAEQLSLLGYIWCVEAGVSLRDRVSRNTLAKYRRICVELGLSHYAGILGRPPADGS